MHRCPKATREREYDDLIRLAVMFEGSGALPAPGGVLDQSAWWVVATGIALSELNTVRKELARREANGGR